MTSRHRHLVNPNAMIQPLVLRPLFESKVPQRVPEISRRVGRLLLTTALGWSAVLLLTAGASAEQQPVGKPAASGKRESATGVDPRHSEKMAAGLALFKEHVAPILRQHCLACHGGAKTRADFSVASRQALMDSGFVAESAADSHLLAILRHEVEPHMPLKKPRLADRQIEWIARWIDLGSPYAEPLASSAANPAEAELQVTDTDRDWWAFRPLQVVAPPEVTDSEWCRSPVDRFVLRRLEEAGLSPSAELPRIALARRLTFDLLGLPPDPHELQDFLESRQPDAWQALIDQLLMNPHYGERWARYWLDVARFAESHGFEHDYDRPHAYHFRDFVIQALNEDLPFDRFVQWQLAGDELAGDSPQALMATGFLGAGVFPTQITANEVERTRYDALDDMASTTGVAFLGLTIGCARCHDHKYDPIPVVDYYRFVATFTTTVRTEIPVDLNPAETARAMDEFNRRQAMLQESLRVFERERLEPGFDAWLVAERGKLQASARWSVLQVEDFRSDGQATSQLQADGSTLVGGSNASSDQYTMTLRHVPPGTRVLRLEALTHESLPQRGPGRADNGNFGLSRIQFRRVPAAATGSRSVVIAAVRATHQQNEGNLSIRSSLDENPSTGWAVDGGGIGKDQAAVFQLEEPLTLDPDERLEVVLQFAVNTRHHIGRFRFSAGSSSDAAAEVGGGIPADIQAAVNQLNEQGGERLSREQRATLFTLYAERDPEWQRRKAELDAHAARKPVPNETMVMVCSEGPHIKPMRHHTQGRDFFDETFLLKRGDTEQKVRPVESGFLQVLMPAGQTVERFQLQKTPQTRTSMRRAALANWMTDPEHGAGALLARVFVNRIWQHHFGSGLVRTANDFGVQGDLPSHPELLDYLAAELIRSGWSTKHIHRLILSSATYRQGNDFRPQAQAVDPENRLLWHRSPQRLEAESVRDTLLALGGRLETRMFGPGSLDPMMRRRGIYFTIKRSRLIPMMQAFDAPEPLVSQGQRLSTTVAPQALFLMNHELIRDAARGLADRIASRIAAEPSDVRLIEAGYQLCCGRQATADEQRLGVEFLAGQTRRYEQQGVVENARRQATIDFAQALLCLNETIFVD